jgi:predicted transposase/invertase (TIGR01784 family)
MLSPKNPIVFKALFSKNPEVLASFLSSFLDKPIEELQGMVILNPTSEANLPKDLLLGNDFTARLKDGSFVNVEMIKDSIPSIWDRTQYYNCKMLVDQLDTGDGYSKLRKVISVVVADFIVIPEDDEIHHQFVFSDPVSGLIVPDSNEIHFLELPKVLPDYNSSLAKWQSILKAKTKEDFTALAENDPIGENVFGVIKNLSGKENIVALADAREKALIDALNLQEGAHINALQEVAQRALKKKMPPKVIAELTGLSLEDIKRLAKT